MNQYEGTLLLYTTIIPICPVLTLTNIPGFCNSIRSSVFRLFKTTLVVVLAGGIIFRGTIDLLSNEAKINRATAEGRPGPFRCVSSFLMRIMPAAAETKMLRFCWALAVVALLSAISLDPETGAYRKKNAATNGGGGSGSGRGAGDDGPGRSSGGGESRRLA